MFELFFVTSLVFGNVDKNLTLADLEQSKKRRLSSSAIFDLPVTYHPKVGNWISYFQGSGRRWFRTWLELSSRYLPYIQSELRRSGLPTDLGYLVMIESGFSASATSSASAVGPWQFIQTTGERYGLQTNWWLDERRDISKSTRAAIKYMKDLYGEFGSWYLVAASYNMGEGGLRARIAKYQTTNYWKLVRLKALPKETTEYVPKILAAMLIAKSPNLYGFRDLTVYDALEYDRVWVPGGTQLAGLADKLKVTFQCLKDLNSELKLGYVPNHIRRHQIRVPVGLGRLADQVLHQKMDPANDRQIVSN